jgi:hypothetical protein
MIHNHGLDLDASYMSMIREVDLCLGRSLILETAKLYAVAQDCEFPVPLKRGTPWKSRRLALPQNGLTSFVNPCSTPLRIRFSDSP